jgi:hypothetical protein
MTRARTRAWCHKSFCESDLKKVPRLALPGFAHPAAQCAVPVSAWDAVVNENEPGSVQKSARGESQIGVHNHLHRFAAIRSSRAILDANEGDRSAVVTALAREQFRQQRG